MRLFAAHLILMSEALLASGAGQSGSGGWTLIGTAQNTTADWIVPKLTFDTTKFGIIFFKLIINADIHTSYAWDPNVIYLGVGFRNKTYIDDMPIAEMGAVHTSNYVAYTANSIVYSPIFTRCNQFPPSELNSGLSYASSIYQISTTSSNNTIDVSSPYIAGAIGYVSNYKAVTGSAGDLVVEYYGI